MKKETTQKTTAKGKPGTLRARVNKHLADKNDVITEDDLKNIKVDADEIAEEEKESAELTEAIEERKVTSPWNVLTAEDK